MILLYALLAFGTGIAIGGVIFSIWSGVALVFGLSPPNGDQFAWAVFLFGCICGLGCPAIIWIGSLYDEMRS